MGTIKRMSAFWQRRSLKFWLATGMMMTFIPILVSAVAGYCLYHRAIIQPLVEVASKQRHILQPLQDVQLTLWDVSDSVIDYAIDGGAMRSAAYKREADKINADFANLVTAVQGHGLEVGDVNEARAGWDEVAALSTTILSSRPLRGEPAVGEKVEELEASLDRLGRRLGTVYDDVRTENEQTHALALADLARSDRLAVAGLVLSIICAALGVVVINRSLVSSMDQLAAGAMRLASGDRSHHIEVHIPHELVNVANAFNLMTGQILEQERALERAAITDGLTGLFNRREFDRMLADEIRRGDRYGTPVSLIIGDIDHFKKLNDTRGHQAGDDVLRAVAQRLKETMRNVDKSCRFGCEEFVLILPETGAEGARQSAERVRVAIEALDIHLEGNQTARVSISLGVATHPDNGATPEALLKSADAALYRSKEYGRNRVTSAVEV